jgi:hypothetical protein
MENQRIADIAAYSGALVYNSTGSTSSTDNAVSNVLALNGLPGSDASTSVVNSPSGDGNQAVQVTVTTSDPLLLARVLTTTANLPVSSGSDVEVKGGTAACIFALEAGGSGVSLSGTGSIDAPACAVASNSTVCANSGANPSDDITTLVISYDSGSSPASSKCTISPPTGTPAVKFEKAAVTDPLCPNGQCVSSVATATSRLSSVAAITSPTVTGGTDIKFAYKKITSGLPSGCSDSWDGSSTHTITCSGASSYTFGNFVLQGGITVNFNVSGISSTTYYFGKGSQSCSGVASYSLCNTGTALNLGPGTYVIAGGIYNGGGATLSIGSGSSGNSYEIGTAADGNSINVSTSNSTTFGDATGNGDVFQTAGNIVSGGGTCFTLPAAAQHDVNGYISLSGGTTMGGGVWTVTNYVAFGAGGGGDVTCNGSSIGIVGNGVTFVIGGSKTYNGQAFYDAAGFDNSTLTAPTSGGTQDLLVVGPVSSSNTAGATFDEGASGNTLSGAFYFPYGAVNFGGAASANNPPNACLELIGATVTLANGTALGTTCSGLPQAVVGQSVALVN